MNFKTTVILLVLLAVVGVVLLFTRDIKPTEETPTEKPLIDIASSDVTRIVFTNDEGTKTALEKSNGKWRLTEPVKAPAEESAANGLIDAFVALKSRGQVDASSATGLDAPRYKVEIVTKDKTIKLDVGSRSAAGDNLYIKREGQARADVVPAAVYEQLEKPLKDFRRARLFDVNAADIKQLKIATTQQSLAMQKQGEDWQITQPQNMPGEQSTLSDMTFAVSNLRAEDFIAQSSSDLKRFGLDQPVMTVTFSTDAPPPPPPATQPTTQPTLTTIQFGRFQDVLKKSVFATVSGDPTVVKTSASVLDSFRKQPLDLRDRRVVTIDPEKVTKISIAIDKPATTQPTTREAIASTVVLERTKQTMGPAEPTSMPATTQSTTQASTQPVEPPSKWNIASKGGVDADDMKVDDLLRDLNPLRADKYFESAPATQPSATITLAIDTTDAHHEIRFVDPGSAKPVNGAYNGLSFEVARFVLDKMEGDFTKTKPAITTE